MQAFVSTFLLHQVCLHLFAHSMDPASTYFHTLFVLITHQVSASTFFHTWRADVQPRSALEHVGPSATLTHYLQMGQRSQA